MSKKRKVHAAIVLTYRCNAKCNMCNVWEHPTKPEEEIGLDVIEKLPDLFFANITGGEPFIRKDMPEIVGILKTKAPRIVISTNGFFTDRIISLCEQYPDIGIRISIEGLQKTNDTIRNIKDGFDRGLRTLLTLRSMGVKDIGFGMTVQNLNCNDLIPLYLLADALGYEFATATLHNSHYFHKLDNKIEDPEPVIEQFKRLIDMLLRSKRPKNWFRAYFNSGLINYIKGNDRYLPCELGQSGFFVDPWGDVLACNGMDCKMPMGNLKEQSFEEIWASDKAEQVRQAVKKCDKQCWMTGSAVPAMYENLSVPTKWVLKNKLRQFFGKELSYPWEQ